MSICFPLLKEVKRLFMEVRSCVSVEMADWKPQLRLVRMLWVGCIEVCDDSRISRRNGSEIPGE